jgi:hypothetical protein
MQVGAALGRGYLALRAGPDFVVDLPLKVAIAGRRSVAESRITAPGRPPLATSDTRWA